MAKGGGEDALSAIDSSDPRSLLFSHHTLRCAHIVRSPCDPMKPKHVSIYLCQGRGRCIEHRDGAPRDVPCATSYHSVALSPTPTHSVALSPTPLTRTCVRCTAAESSEDVEHAVGRRGEAHVLAWRGEWAGGIELGPRFEMRIELEDVVDKRCTIRCSGRGSRVSVHTRKHARASGHSGTRCANMR